MKLLVALTMTQQQIESLTQEEYCHLLSYGDALYMNPEENAYDQAHVCVRMIMIPKDLIGFLRWLR